MCLPGKEEQLRAGLTGATNVALAMHQLLHTLQIQTCIHETLNELLDTLQIQTCI